MGDVFTFDGSVARRPPLRTFAEQLPLRDTQQMLWYGRADGWIALPLGRKTPDGAALLANPDPLYRLSETRGLRGYLYYDMLAKDNHLAGDWEKITATVLELPVKVAAGRQDSTEHATRAARVEEIMNEIPDWYDVREQLLMAEGVGRAAAEIDWRVRPVGGRDAWVPSLTLLGPDDLLFDDLGRPWWCPDGTGATVLPIEPGKLLLLRRGVTPRNPFGWGRLRRSYFPYWLKRDGGIKAWAYYLERRADPTVKGTWGNDVTPEEADTFVANLEAMKKGGVLAHHKKFESSLMEAMVSGTVTSFDTFCDFLNKEISKGLMGHTLSSEPAERGNTATADLQGDMFSATVRKFAHGHSRGVDQGLARLVEYYNLGMPPDGKWASWQVDADPEEDQVDKLTLYQGLHALGLQFGQEQLATEFRVKLMPAGDTPLARAPVVAPPDPMDGPPNGGGPMQQFAHAPHALTAREQRLVRERRRVETAAARAIETEVGALADLMLRTVRAGDFPSPGRATT